MRKALKISAFILGVLIVLFIIAIILLVTFVNPNRFKTQISQAVNAKTGRELVIAGNISWSFFPWLGVSVDKVSLSNAPGFGDQPFAQIGEADVRIKVVPLFSGDVEIGRVTLKNLSVNLIKNADGTTNWQDLLQQQSDTSHAASPVAPSPKSKNSTVEIKISKLRVENAQLSWIDKQKNQEANITQLNLYSDDLNLQSTFPLNINFSLHSNKPGLSLTTHIQTKAFVNLQMQQYTLDDLKIMGHINNTQFDQGQLDFEINGNITADMQHQTLAANDVTVMLGNMRLMTSFQGSSITTTPIMTGDVSVPPFNLKKLLTTLGITYQPQSEDALKTASTSFQFQASPKFLKVDELTIGLDQTTANGRFDFSDFANKAIDFNLAIDKINVDRYLLAQPQSVASQAGTKQTSSSAKSNPQTPLIPAETIQLLRTLNLDGSINIGSLVYQNLTMTNFKLQLTAKKGIVNASPITANLYNGNTQTNFNLNVSSNTPRFSIHEKVANVQVGPLLKDMGTTNKISGTANFNSSLTASGNTNQAFMSSLNGNIGLALKDGAIQGVDIPAIISQAQHFLKTQQIPQFQEGGQTKFAELTATAQITNGLLRNNDLLLQSALFTASGNGTANLVNQALNYNIAVKPAAGNFTLPVKVGCTIAKPCYSPDFSAIATEVVKQQIQKQIEKQLPGDVGKTLQKLLPF